MSHDASGPPWHRVLSGTMRAVRLGYVPARDERRTAQVIFPGSFNPFHRGHREMARLAGELLNRKVEFELSVVNVDKPPLAHADVGQRVEQFDETQIVWITRTATFAEKARLFPQATFVVGADTLQRIVRPEYYRGAEKGLERALDVIRKRKCEFLVFGRQVNDAFVTAADLDLPDTIRERCHSLGADEFRIDVSSSQQRESDSSQQRESDRA